MADIKQLERALINADAAGDADAARALAGEIRKMRAGSNEAEQSSTSDSSLVALGAGLGKGFGQVALNAQRYLGKGINAVGDFISPPERTITSLVTGKREDGNVVGNWLVDDAERGLRKIEGELAPYKENSPIAATTGEIGGNVIATLPVGGVLASGVRAIAPGAGALASSIASGGFRTGLPAATTMAGRTGNTLTRIAGGGITGGVAGGLVDPNSAATGAAIGAILPPSLLAIGRAGGKVADGLHSSANRLMQSSIKPTIKELKSGDAAIAVQTLLDNGISPNAKGVNKLRDLISVINDDIANRIAGSNAVIDKGNVVNALGGTRQKFANQVSPTSDLNAISGVVDDFMSHPTYPGQTLPIQAAQELKRGTYKTLAKKYGQLGSAEVEAQKGLARGLKDEIANAIPEIAGLNAQEAKLITTLNVAERRALMEMNKNPMGLAALATNPASWAAFMADRSAGFKAIAARMLNRATLGAQSVSPRLGRDAPNPLLRTSPVLFAANGE